MRKVILRLSNRDHFGRAMIELMHSTDRSAAILGGTYVDSALEELLRLHLHGDDEFMV